MRRILNDGRVLRSEVPNLKKGYYDKLLHARRIVIVLEVYILCMDRRNIEYNVSLGRMICEYFMLS